MITKKTIRWACIAVAIIWIVVFAALLTGCDPTSSGGGRADKAGHPKSPPASSNQNKVKVKTGDNSKKGKVCWERDIGQKRHEGSHVLTCVQHGNQPPHWEG